MGDSKKMVRRAVYLNQLGLVNCLGRDKGEVLRGLFSGDLPEYVEDCEAIPDVAIMKAACSFDLPEMPVSFSSYNTRNNQLALAALLQIEGDVREAISRYGASNIGVVLGSSTSGIKEGEEAMMASKGSEGFPDSFDLAQQGMGDVASFVADYLGLTGPAYTISSACTSSAKALVSARNLLLSGQCKAVVSGGSDSLCRLTLNGFYSLEALSKERCNSMSLNRDGLIIGEGSALFFMTCEGPGIQLLGAGASSDAHHISAPEPDGLGAEAAMRAAVEDACLAPEDISYVNLHGTATPQNDVMESKALSRVFEGGVLCSSTKALTGHTLGAAGATEAALCWLVLSEEGERVALPPHHWDGEVDPSLPELSLVGEGQRIPVRECLAVLSNSFAFGGNNCSLVLGREREGGAGGNQVAYSVEELLPHRRRMILLDSVVACSSSAAECRLTIKSSDLFFNRARGGVPVWIGYEYMAQTMAVYSGALAKRNNEAVKVGLLVANRKGFCHVPYFFERQQLHVSVLSAFEADGMGVFDCTIEDVETGACLMEAALNVYLPPDLGLFLEQARGG